MLEELEGKVTKKLFQEFSGTKIQNVDALSKLNEFFSETKFGAQSVTLREDPRILTQKTRNQTRTVPRIVLVVK